MILLLDERQRKELAQYSPYIAIPKVSSQNRRYIPMDYLEGEIIPGDKLFTMPSATSYEFGILQRSVCPYCGTTTSVFYIQESAFVKRPVLFIYRKSRRLKT